LPLSALDLDAGWVNYARPKTGISHRCPLWPETVTALRTAIAERPEPREEETASLVFVTTRGLRPDPVRSPRAALCAAVKSGRWPRRPLPQGAREGTWTSFRQHGRDSRRPPRHRTNTSARGE